MNSSLYPNIHASNLPAKVWNTSTTIGGDVCQHWPFLVDLSQHTPKQQIIPGCSCQWKTGGMANDELDRPTALCNLSILSTLFVFFSVSFLQSANVSPGECWHAELSQPPLPLSGCIIPAMRSSVLFNFNQIEMFRCILKLKRNVSLLHFSCCME